jgi:hypothetical protein
MKTVDDVFTELAQVRIRLDQIERNGSTDLPSDLCNWNTSRKSERKMTIMTKQKASIYALEALIALALAFAIVFSWHTIAGAQQATSTFTDRNGHFAGSSTTHGPKTDFYDARGRYQGTTTQQGTPSNPLGNVDGSKPFGNRR